jgi:hypothetical protein
MLMAIHPPIAPASPNTFRAMAQFRLLLADQNRAKTLRKKNLLPGKISFFSQFANTLFAAFCG